MIKLNKNKTTSLNSVEKKALIYLTKNNVEIDYDNLVKPHQPDIMDKQGNGYEVKKIKSNKTIIFTEYQYNNFKDETIILVFELFNQNPILKTTMGIIRKQKRTINNSNIGIGIGKFFDRVKPIIKTYKKMNTRIVNWGTSKAIKIPYALLIHEDFPFKETEFNNIIIEIIKDKLVISRGGLK